VSETAVLTPEQEIKRALSLSATYFMALQLRTTECVQRNLRRLAGGLEPTIADRDMEVLIDEGNRIGFVVRCLGEALGKPIFFAPTIVETFNAEYKPAPSRAAEGAVP
jgi:hypothetical protein